MSGVRKVKVKIQNCENMENTLEIKVFIKSILFCKYLRNGSSDPYEILCDGQLLNFKLHKDLCINARAGVVNALTRDKTCAHLFTPHAREIIHGSSLFDKIVN